VGLFQSEITIEGLNEFNPYHRQAKTNVLVALLGAGLEMQDQRGARTARFQITDRGQDNLRHGPKKVLLVLDEFFDVACRRLAAPRDAAIDIADLLIDLYPQQPGLAAPFSSSSFDILCPYPCVDGAPH
jgi:hypothetical protein